MTKSILETVHETAHDLAQAGVMEVATLREFDALCLPPVKDYTPTQIKRIRAANKARSGGVCYLPQYQPIDGAEMGAGQEEAQRAI